MYSGNDDYSPVSDYYGQDQQPKSFRESLKETVENIGGSAGSYAGEAGSAGKEMAKKYLPIAIIIIILLVIILGVMWILGQNATLTYTIKALDGEPIDTARIMIFYADDPNKTPLPYNGKDTSKHTFTLNYGTYTLRVIGDNEHKPYTEERLVIDSESKDRTIELVRNIDAKIKKIDFDSERIFSGQEKTGIITIENEKDEELIGEIITDSKLVTITMDKSFKTPKGERQLPFNIKAKEVTSETEDEITFRIKGTKISNKIKLKIYPTINSKKDLTINGIKNPYVNETLEAGNTKALIIPITIKNNNKKIPLENLKITITPESGYEEHLNWFEFSDTGSDKSTITIEKISPTTEERITLAISVPIENEIGDEFKGTLKMESPSMDVPITYSTIFKVKTKKIAEITFTPASVTVQCTDYVCNSVNNLNIGSIKNTGKQKIESIKLKLADGPVEGIMVDPLCPIWLTLTKTEIPEIDISASELVYANLTPHSDFEDKTSILCVLQWEFTDPTNNTQVNKQKEILIKIANRISNK
ncbi:MAG: hypothetical protein GX950_01655 [Candidatus Diapherotrites archaeon]|uniref:Uncharacterized protein n=1 Tax=Candidatus Iainarchaeum sp. TaxID=3101447 RepID=A0A7K4BZJ9_9ARCH|nr:hypothetical protein [Candidatus Diapherotrites archaeon]